MSQQSQPTADEATPVKDIKAPTVKSFQRFMRSILILSLSILCVIGGLLIYQLHIRLDKVSPVLPKINKSQSLQVPFSKTIRKTQTEASVLKKQPIQKQEVIIPNILTTDKEQAPVILVQKPTTNDILPSSSITPKEEKGPIKETVNPVLESPSLIQQKNNDGIDIKASNLPKDVPPATQAYEPIPILDAPYFTLQDALILRDHLQTGKSCRSDLQKLLKTKTQYHSWHSLIDKLTPICVTDDETLHKIHTIFRKEYKHAIIAYYRMNNPWWLAYIKAVPATIVEIRKVHPTEQTPLDLLYVAKNALIQGNLRKTADTIKSLPQPMQTTFKKLTSQINIYLKAQDEVEQFVLSFEQKGK